MSNGTNSDTQVKSDVLVSMHQIGTMVENGGQPYEVLASVAHQDAFGISVTYTILPIGLNGEDLGLSPKSGIPAKLLKRVETTTPDIQDEDLRCVHFVRKDEQCAQCIIIQANWNQHCETALTV